MSDIERLLKELLDNEARRPLPGALERSLMLTDEIKARIRVLEADFDLPRGTDREIIARLKARAEKAEAALAELAEYRLSNDGRSLSIEKCSRTYQIAKRAAGRESGSPKG